jgi:hypothetical protein
MPTTTARLFVEFQFVAYLEWNSLPVWHYLRQFVFSSDYIDNNSVAPPQI